MTPLLLLLGGVAAGLCGSVAGLASLVSYPALLATGLGPIAANVTNTTAMVASAAGSAAGSRPELRGQGRRVLVTGALCVLGGLVGAGLLLVTDEEVFGAVVPVLIALGATLLLVQEPLRRWALRRRGDHPLGERTSVAGVLVVLAVAVYGGFFGAGVGIILLAVLAAQTTERLAITNAVKNVCTGMSNLAAALVYAAFAPVDWAAAGVLALGVLLGSAMGPAVVRVAPERPLRVLIGLGGYGLALWLALG